MSPEETTPAEGDFRLFIQKLAMQGFYSLGMIELPGQELPEPNFQVCKAVIDDLIVLREKTEGNLSEGERSTLDKFLSDLQFQFVNRQKTSGAAE